MTSNQKRKLFARLHNEKQPFFLPNPWDIGSAKMMSALGVKALATTSAGYSFHRGVASSVGILSRKETLDYARDIVGATDLPVSADLENGFGSSPEDVVKTIEKAIKIGLAGGSIEDTSNNREAPVFDRGLAKERIAAAVETVNRLDPDFVLTARAENFLFGRNDLKDTISRLQDFEAAGADVLYAPGLPDIAAITTVCENIGKPVNVVAGIGLNGVTMAQLHGAGVVRVSAGSALTRVAYGAMVETTNRILQNGSFADFAHAASFSSLDRLVENGAPSIV